MPCSDPGGQDAETKGRGDRKDTGYGNTGYKTETEANTAV